MPLVGSVSPTGLSGGTSLGGFVHSDRLIRGKNRLPELLRQVKSGKSFTITNRGEAIADLVPSAGERKKDRVEAAKRLGEFMLADPIPGVPIKRLIEEGRA